MAAAHQHSSGLYRLVVVSLPSCFVNIVNTSWSYPYIYFVKLVSDWNCWTLFLFCFLSSSKYLNFFIKPICTDFSIFFFSFFFTNEKEADWHSQHFMISISDAYLKIRICLKIQVAESGQDFLIGYFLGDRVKDRVAAVGWWAITRNHQVNCFPVAARVAYDAHRPLI